MCGAGAASRIIAAVLSLLSISSIVQAQEPDGSPGNPYLISDVAQLIAVGDNPDKCFKLMTDIDLAASSFAPIPFFSGVFDGDGHTISNLSYSDPDGFSVGLFGMIDSGGQVIDLTLVNVNISGDTWVGGLAGLCDGTISGCHVTGQVTGQVNGMGYYYDGGVGGLVGGCSYGGVLSDCSAAVTVTAGPFSVCVGGLAGLWRGDILRCSASGDVSGNMYVGGLAGACTRSVSDSYATASVNGEFAVGGLVGESTWSISDCYSAGIVSGSVDVGGLAGHAWCYVTASFWDAEINGQAPSGIGLSTALMKTKSTFTDAGWDFVNVWGIVEGSSYPTFGPTDSGGGSTNSPPVAVIAASDGTITVDDTVTLDGSGSSDPEGKPITCLWAFVNAPQGSAAKIVALTTDPNFAEFTPDVAGDYRVYLVVNDGDADSLQPAEVTITVLPLKEATLQTLDETGVSVSDIPIHSFSNEHLITPLTNKIEAAQALIAAGSYQQALDKLQNDILPKTDGCAVAGTPDRTDWILTCEGQAQVYPVAQRVIELLQRLIAQ